MCDSVWPHSQQTARLLRPWDFPGKGTGVGCHCRLLTELISPTFLTWTTVKRKIEITLKIERGMAEFENGRKERKSEVTQSCLTLCDPTDCNPPGSSIHGIFQARILERVAISFSRRSSHPRDWTQVSCIAGRRFTTWATREAWWGGWQIVFGFD